MKTAATASAEETIGKSSEGKSSERKGIALAAAIGSLVVIGVMIAGVFFSASQEYRVGNNAVTQEKAFRAAEFGLNTTLANWDAFTLNNLAIGATKKYVYDSTAKGWVDTVDVTRINLTGYQLVSTATGTGPFGGKARRRTAMNVRLSILSFVTPGAMAIKGPTKISGSASLTGVDSNPTTWTDCPVATASVAGLAMPLTTDLSAIKLSNLAGVPPLNLTSLAGDTSTYSNFGDETWSSLTASATKVFTGSQTLNSIAPSVSGGTCNTALSTNWGAPIRVPANACSTYYPIIWIKGSTSTTTINGGGGQGILMVEGDLNISGGFSFYGPIIVRGKLSISGGGGSSRFYGQTLVANLNNTGQSDMTGSADFRYSSCVIAAVSRAMMAPRRVAQRAWTEMF